MNRHNTVKVIISGTDFNFKTDDPDHIRQLAGFVDERIRDIESTGKVSSHTKAITLAAFNIADELFRLRAEKEETLKNLSRRLDAMLAMAEDARRESGDRRAG